MPKLGASHLSSPASTPRKRMTMARVLLGAALAAIVGTALVATSRVPSKAWLAVAADPTTSSSGPSPSPTAAPSSASERATKVCEARLAQLVGHANPMRVTLATSYPATSADVAVDEENKSSNNTRSSFRDRPSDEFEAVCWFDSAGFGLAPTPAQPGSVQPTFTTRRQEVVRPDGVAIVERAGQTASLDTAPISSAGAVR
jgi:hypothetical protein